MKSRFHIHIVNGVLWSYVIAAVVIFAGTLWAGSTDIAVLHLPLAEFDIKFGLRFDFLSTLLLVMVTILGGVIGQYSLRYLDGETGQERFYRHLLSTVSAVALLVLSSNLLMFFLMWVATSWSLHKLLVFYPDRKPALLAARKKFLISRLGDLAILGGIFLTYQVYGTLEFSELFSMASSSTVHDGMLGLIGFCFALGAMTKSAQFPFHFWLPETMETPTPVSALMHAGIINAGGFLIIRLSPLLQHAEAAHVLLIIMGAFTAIFGALVMITQNDIKKKLAYSTISQMGMMMLACGLGAYSIALFHMVAHSFYKAHAFLTTGLIVDESKRSALRSMAPSTSRFAFASIAGLLLLAFGSIVQDGAYFAQFTYASVLLLGLVQGRVDSIPSSISSFKVILHVISLMILAMAGFALLEYTVNHGLSRLVPEMWGANPYHSSHGLAGLIAYAFFVAGLWLSSRLSHWPGLYVYLWNGGYFTVATNRLMQRHSVI